MSYSIFQIIGGGTVKKGVLPKKPCKWECSAWFIKPDGEKAIYSFTIEGATKPNVATFLCEQIQLLGDEMGNVAIEVGWTAHSVGSNPKPKRKKR